jgi:hypothetical protein
MPTSRAVQRLANRGNPHHPHHGGFGFGGGTFPEPSEEEVAKEILRPVVSDGASIGSPTSWNAATLAPRGKAATLLINTDLTPLATRAAACAAVLEESPELLSVGRRVLLTGSLGQREPQDAVVIGDVELEGTRKHIMLLQGESVELMDLAQRPLVLEPCGRAVHQLLGKLLAPPGTHLHECMTCMECLESQAFGSFCYAHYKVRRPPRSQQR